MTVNGTTSTDLALPDPAVVAAAALSSEVVLRATEIRARCEEDVDLDGADELRRRLHALAEYVDAQQTRRAVEGEERRTEVLIGRLLGPAENHGPATFHAVNGSALHPALRHQCRRLAAFAELVEEMVTGGKTERAVILREIDERDGTAQERKRIAGEARKLIAQSRKDPASRWRHTDKLDLILREIEYLPIPWPKEPPPRKPQKPRKDGSLPWPRPPERYVVEYLEEQMHRVAKKMGVYPDDPAGRARAEVEALLQPGWGAGVLTTERFEWLATWAAVWAAALREAQARRGDLGAETPAPPASSPIPLETVSLAARAAACAAPAPTRAGTTQSPT
jgi:hypothetical protein